MHKISKFVCLDVGEKRIGVAIGDSDVRIAVPYDTVDVDGDEIQAIGDIYAHENADVLVIGYPRNQSGETTAQTEYVEKFAKRLAGIAENIVFQDESLTSVLAEQQLTDHKRPYNKSDIDAMAAAIILNDYIKENYG